MKSGCGIESLEFKKATTPQSGIAEFQPWTLI